MTTPRPMSRREVWARVVTRAFAQLVQERHLERPTVVELCDAAAQALLEAPAEVRDAVPQDSWARVIPGLLEYWVQQVDYVNAACEVVPGGLEALRESKGRTRH